jgi:hypothetical protein
LGAVLAGGAAAAVILAATASATVIFDETFHFEDTTLEEDFCDISGLTVEFAIVRDVRVKAVPHGRDGLAYFNAHVEETSTATNVENGNSTTLVLRFVDKDLRVTDNGDGTLTILIMTVGNRVLYDEDGNVLARDPGQERIEILVDHGGTPADPSNDEFLEFLGVAKEPTGRNADFCEAAAPVLLG